MRESPQVVGGFIGVVGVRGVEAGPSPARRLSIIDRKWLERCQVFGEMEAEVRPAAGNRETVPDNRVDGEIKGKMNDGKEEKDAEEVKGEAADFGVNEGFEGIGSDKKVCSNAPEPSRHHTGKSSEVEEKVYKKGDEEMERGATPLPVAEDENELSHKSKGTKKRARKRQREGENMEGEMSEELGVKKRRRRAKDKEESFGEKLSPTPAGEKKRRGRKKTDEDGEIKEEKDTKVPKKVSFMSAYCV